MRSATAPLGEQGAEESKPLVLASSSPRRRMLLAALATCAVVTPAVEEAMAAGERPVDMARRLAVEKAIAGAELAADAVAEGARVVGADTVVVHDGTVYGKPRDATAARSVLRRLRGRRHLVITGVAVVWSHQPGVPRPPEAVRVGHGPLHSLAAVSHTGVWLRAMPDEEIDRYVASGSPLDKAGAYAVQDAEAAPVAHLVGSETNVVGLPLTLTRRLLSRAAGQRL